MNATEFIRMSLDNSKNWLLALINDMRDAPLAQPTSNGGNHPIWILGHLAYSEANLIDCFILGRANRLREWEELFGTGSTPTSDISNYPTLDELLTKFEAVRAATVEHLGTLDDKDLDKKSHAPQEYGPFFSTIGACFSTMAAHVLFHTGQMADARRALGRKPVMA